MKENASKKEVMQKIATWNVFAENRNILSKILKLKNRQKLYSLFDENRKKGPKSVDNLWTDFKNGTFMTDEGLYFIYDVIVSFEYLQKAFQNIMPDDAQYKYKYIRDFIGTYISDSVYCKAKHQEYRAELNIDSTTLDYMDMLKKQADLLVGVHATFNYFYWKAKKSADVKENVNLVEGFQAIYPEYNNHLEKLQDTWNRYSIKFVKLVDFILYELLIKVSLKVRYDVDPERMSTYALDAGNISKYYDFTKDYKQYNWPSIYNWDETNNRIQFVIENKLLSNTLNETFWLSEDYKTLYAIFSNDGGQLALIELSMSKIRNYSLYFNNKSVIIYPCIYPKHFQAYNYELTDQELILMPNVENPILPNKLKKITDDEMDDYLYLLERMEIMNDEIAHKIISNAYATADGFFMTIDDTANNTTKKYCYAFKKDNQGRMDSSEKYKELAFVTPFDKLDLSFWDNDIYLVYESKSLFIPLSVFMQQKEKDMD